MLSLYVISCTWGIFYAVYKLVEESSKEPLTDEEVSLLHLSYQQEPDKGEKMNNTEMDEYRRTVRVARTHVRELIFNDIFADSLTVEELGILFSAFNVLSAAKTRS